MGRVASTDSTYNQEGYMMIAELTEDKVGLTGYDPAGNPVAATLFKGNRHRVLRATDDHVVLLSDADGAEFKTSWRGVRIIRDTE